MTYATRADLVDRFGATELEQLDPGVAGDGGTRSYPKTDAALADAALEMDASLAVRHTLPLDAAQATSPLLKRICAQLARYLLYDEEAPDRVVDGVKEARKMLAGLASGAMVLPGVRDDASAGGPTALPARAGPAPVMTPDNLQGY